MAAACAAATIWAASATQRSVVLRSVAVARLVATCHTVDESVRAALLFSGVPAGSSAPVRCRLMGAASLPEGVGATLLAAWYRGWPAPVNPAPRWAPTRSYGRRDTETRSHQD